ncbi:hypothetical protein PAXRUDRAFT_28139 [Paxillus rubicundulus Ve08.2h10]|uniref:Uncharacterized protein n=1 Tax=Paxillus rubicundulus Ve08.2h10 TaxID=930991 RepID=A0A0D0CY70_9AGAM|nr:hypothetical protein PAXRUDRAFT_28139 [Paxillus rubicundulus Ve08.2h10]
MGEHLEGSGDGESPPSSTSEIETAFYGHGDRLYRNFHTKLNACPCDKQGNFLPQNTPPKPNNSDPDDWTPYDKCLQFETAELLFTRCEMSVEQINILLDLWAASLLKYRDSPPFASAHHMYKIIDDTPLGNVKWQKFGVQYTGNVPQANPPPWMSQTFEVWFHDLRSVIH